MSHLNFNEGNTSFPRFTKKWQSKTSWANKVKVKYRKVSFEFTNWILNSLPSTWQINRIYPTTKSWILRLSVVYLKLPPNPTTSFFTFGEWLLIFLVVLFFRNTREYNRTSHQCLFTMTSPKPFYFFIFCFLFLINSKTTSEVGNINLDLAICFNK